MKNRNLYLGIFLIIISVIGILIYNLIPNFETTEFDQNAIIQISEGSTTTLLEGDSTTTTTIVEEINEIIDIEQSEIDKLLQNNNTTNISEYFETYLLIGSDRRSENSSASRGFVQGQRADVIILALINKSTENIALVSLPRDLLIKNPCTQEVQRINSTFQKNECGNSPENLSASILNITGLLVNHLSLIHI